MLKQIPFELEIGQRVRIKDGIDQELIGEFARSGNPGWIMDRQHDRLGYAHVLFQPDFDAWSLKCLWGMQSWFEPDDTAPALDLQPTPQPNEPFPTDGIEIDMPVSQLVEDFVKRIVEISDRERAATTA